MKIRNFGTQLTKLSLKIWTIHWPIILILCLFTLLYGFLVTYRHLTFQTHAFDLGLYDQVIWLYSRLQIPYSTIREMVIVSDHFHPILLLFVPFYWLGGSSLLLLWLQVLLVVTSVIPVYLLSSKKLNSKLVALLLSISYLLFFGVQSALEFDFHVATVSIFFLSWLLYFYQTNSGKWFWLFVFLTLICKEDMSLIVLMLGLYDLITKRVWGRAITLVLLGLGVFLLFQFVISPLYNPNPETYINLSIPGSSFIDQGKYLVTHPVEAVQVLSANSTKQETLFYLFASFLFLPLLSPLALFLVTPVILSRFLSIYPFRWGLGYHYNVNIVPILVFGVLEVMVYWSTLKRIRLSAAYKQRVLVAVCLLMITVQILATFEKKTFLSWFIQDRVSMSQIQLSWSTKSLIDQIPDGAVVSASSAFVPHLAHRKQIYYYPNGLKDVEYVMISQDVETFPLSYEEIANRISRLKVNKEFQLIGQVQNTYLFKRIK